MQAHIRNPPRTFDTWLVVALFTLAGVASCADAPTGAPVNENVRSARSIETVYDFEPPPAIVMYANGDPNGVCYQFSGPSGQLVGLTQCPRRS